MTGKNGDAFFVGPDGQLWTWSSDRQTFVHAATPTKGETGDDGSSVRVTRTLPPSGITPPAIPADAKEGDLVWDPDTSTFWRVTA